jgi:hypothetical protein
MRRFLTLGVAETYAKHLDAHGFLQEEGKLEAAMPFVLQEKPFFRDSEQDIS